MGRRLTAALLLVLPVGQVSVVSVRAVGTHLHDCRCDKTLCHCLHKHKKLEIPKCHFPGGTAGPSVQRCDNDETAAVAASHFLPPSAPVVSGAAPVAAVPEPPALEFDSFSPEVSPPPPRLRLA